MYAVADPRISEQGGTVEFLRSGGCFDAPSHIPYGFAVRVEGKLNINIKLQTLFVDSMKVYTCYAVIIYKNKPPKHFKKGDACRVRPPWIRLWYNKSLLYRVLYLKANTCTIFKRLMANITTLNKVQYD